MSGQEDSKLQDDEALMAELRTACQDIKESWVLFWLERYQKSQVHPNALYLRDAIITELGEDSEIGQRSIAALGRLDPRKQIAPREDKK